MLGQKESTDSIHALLEEFRDAARNSRDLGDKFERLFAAFLRLDPYYADHFSDVWLWMEWPGRQNRPDTGIDLVARQRATGDLTAIQCKFFDPDYTLQKSDIDSFFTASGKAPFTSRLIVSTTDKWSKHAEDALNAQQIPVQRLGIAELADSALDWSQFDSRHPARARLKPKNKLRDHQKEAKANVLNGLKKADRGKLIMACGTGKTFTALKIAEDIAPKSGAVLILVPSISLISQTLSEWVAQAERPLHCFAVCSDPKVGQKNDAEDITTHDLAYPAHTNPQALARQVKGMKKASPDALTVIFSTYQSIKVVAESQAYGIPEFDLIICDEAHRTTGIEQDGDASAFTSVHKDDFIKAKKRLYMTATPRIYDDASKGKAKEADIVLYSMDDKTVYGEELHRLDFSEAVRRDLLSDYKVMVLAVDEKHVDRAFQSQLADKNHELTLEDAVKIVGCWNGLAKRMAAPDPGNANLPIGSSSAEAGAPDSTDPAPMRRAVAFSRSIKDSKSFKNLFAEIIRQYTTAHAPARNAGILPASDPETSDPEVSNPEVPDPDPDFLSCEVDHVDGTMNALKRVSALQWLKAETGANRCRILSNARCLSEGVDVPALDAVMFLNPRNSVVDVVQSVGRVMRKAPGKKYGYIILPIGIPADMEPEAALADNEKYKVVWQVLQALRAHDDRFNAIINKLDLNKERPGQIQIIGVGAGPEPEPGQAPALPTPVQLSLSFPQLENWKDAIFARIVLKCGTRKYWEQWAHDVAQIATRHITRIKGLLESSNGKYRQPFEEFLEGLRAMLNPSIGEDDAVEMLAQHLITKPVFDALFERYEFTKQNPVSVAMSRMLAILEGQSLQKETASLDRFYDSVRERATGIDNAAAKQKIVIELYDKFFKMAFPRMAERLGIVFTPIPIVDFILHTADDALKAEFGVGLTDENVHVLDPFTGTGSFIVRALQTGLIDEKDLLRKYTGELHANEIVLLAYYIAAINIEEAFHDRAKQPYQPFGGIVLTDTFQMFETKGTLNETMFPENNQRARRQKNTEIRVIVANPPYSAGQASQNDANQNLKYPNLDCRISETYASASNATLQRNLYDSYVRAIRWASDRIGNRGIMCYVSNGSFIDANNMDGLRKCLFDEFTSVYCFNLRGNQRTSGETSRREGGKIFGSGSRAQIAITLFIKNPERQKDTVIHYHDIGDYLSREEKLKIIANFTSTKNLAWEKLVPNKDGDWINQRDPAFERFTAVGDKDGLAAKTFFSSYSLGVVTNRDAWTYNFSQENVAANMARMIAFYNEQVKQFREVCKHHPENVKVDDFINNNPKNISWTRALKNEVAKFAHHAFTPSCVLPAMYRPFCKQWLYFNRRFNEMVCQIPSMFPTSTHSNLAIAAVGIGASKDFSAVITDTLPDLELISKGQWLPLYTYKKIESKEGDEPDQGELISVQNESELIDGYRRQTAITEAILIDFRKTYDPEISKEDIFYYVYGILHSPEYKRRFASDLRKMLPRIPFAADFWAFSKAGRQLADIHLNYECATPYPLQQQCDVLALDPKSLYHVEKMTFGKRDKRPDKSTLIYNSHITLSGIPLETYDYVVNGKPALEWIIERYAISKDPDSQIVNDPNDWATEHNDPQYILNLVKRIVTVSLETMKIVHALPPLHER
jgi:predicted helicase